jgi:hypothetical protein
MRTVVNAPPFVQHFSLSCSEPYPIVGVSTSGILSIARGFHHT